MDINLQRKGAPAGSPPSLLLFVPGGVLVLIGLFILWNPNLLIYMIAGVFIALGVLITLLLLAARKLAGRGLGAQLGSGMFGNFPPFGDKR